MHVGGAGVFKRTLLGLLGWASTVTSARHSLAGNKTRDVLAQGVMERDSE